MKQWEVTRLGSKTIRFSHPQSTYIFDFCHSCTFDLNRPPDQDFLQKAEKVMKDTEKGLHVNGHEDRMAGQFWLRNPDLAPDKEIGGAIKEAIKRCKGIAAAVHEGRICNEAGRPFRYLVVVGVGGSQLGFQFIARALAKDSFRLQPFSLDNTDPETVDMLIRNIGPAHLAETLFVMASKSGKTTEIKNSYKILEGVYAGLGLQFSKHAIAITMADTELYHYAKSQGWLDIFPVWEWVGGRFSVLSPVGLLPLALLGMPVDSLLAGARAMDELTRSTDYHENPAMLLTHYLLMQSIDQKKQNMVVLPYKDRLELWGRFLQQLFMESLGKTLEKEGSSQCFGLTVYGNKGTTDQHSYIQQLLAGHNDFFVLFFSVLQQAGEVQQRVVEEGGITMGDYLLAFCHGTMKAMAKQGRESMLITLDKLDPFSLGGLVALFERVVGYYAACVGINPYDQPQVEEGKRSANDIIRLKKKLNSLLENGDGQQRKDALCLEHLQQSFLPGEYNVLYYLLHQMKEAGQVSIEQAELDKLLR